MTNTATYCRTCHIAAHRPTPRPGVDEWRALVGDLLNET